MSAAVLVGWHSLESDRMGAKDGFVLGENPEPMVIHFGGDTSMTRRRYSRDLRALKLRATGAIENDDAVEQGRSFDCDWRLEEGGEAWRVWQDTCGVGGAGAGSPVCNVEEILIMAFCRRNYQTVNNL